MEYTLFGATGRRVSRIGFGGAVAGLRNYLHEYDPQSEESVRGVVEAIHKALELGINYFDTAPGYGGGVSEKMFGLALDGIKPDEVFLATKSGFCDYDALMRSVEQSLQNLRRDSIDLLQIHGDTITPEREAMITAPHGMLEAMEEVRRQGLVKYIGFTTEDNNEAVFRFIHSGRFDSIQMCYNFLFQHAYEPSRPFGTLYEAEKAHLGIATMRAPTSGTFQRWVQMVNPQNTFDYTPALIQFVLSNPLVDVALIGMRTAQRVEQNVKIANDMSGRIDIAKMHTRYV